MQPAAVRKKCPGLSSPRLNAAITIESEINGRNGSMKSSEAGATLCFDWPGNLGAEPQQGEARGEAGEAQGHPLLREEARGHPLFVRPLKLIRHTRGFHPRSTVVAGWGLAAPHLDSGMAR